MDVKQLNYFVTIVNEGSISAAARKLFMSQPPLSYQMKMLENELGCVLFERGVKNVALTEKGKALYARANDILSLVKSTSDEVKGLEKQKSIRIGIVSSLIDYLCDRIKEYQNNHQVRFEMVEGNTYELLDDLEKGLVSMIIVRTPFANHRFLENKVMDDYLVAVGNDLTEQISITDLCQKPLIVYRRWLDIIENQFSEQGFLFQPSYLNDDARTSISLAKKGLGIALVPKSCTMDCGLPVARIKDCVIKSEVTLLYKKDTSLTETDMSFVKSIMNSVK